MEHVDGNSQSLHFMVEQQESIKEKKKTQYRLDAKNFIFLSSIRCLYSYPYNSMIE